MTMEAPEFFNVQEAINQKATHDAATSAVGRLRELAKTGGTTTMPVDAKRHFVSPTHPNERYLVVAGKPQMAPLQQNNLGMQAAVQREGDVWAVFASGVCSTEDPEVIEWLEAHSGDPADHAAYHVARNQEPRGCGTPVGLCQEKGPGVDDWYKMKLAQTPLANRPIALDPEIDVDAHVRALRNARKAQDASNDISRGVEKVIEANENASIERAQAGNRQR